MSSITTHMVAARKGLLDVLNALRKGLLWAWLEVVCQYRRSRIGPLWETINMIVIILGLSVVSAAIFNGDFTSRIGYIGLGVMVWSALSSLVTEGTTTFIRNSDSISNSNIGVDLHVYRTVCKVLITFGHHLILYVVGIALALIPLHWSCLLAIPGVLLLFLNGFWVVTVLAFICARFRDVELIVRNLLQLGFFVTPVFWDYHQIEGGRRFIVDYNVLFYFMEIIRAPLLGQVPPLRDYLVVVMVTLLGFALTVLTHRRMRRELAFFV